MVVLWGGESIEIISTWEWAPCLRFLFTIQCLAGIHSGNSTENDDKNGSISRFNKTMDGWIGLHRHWIDKGKYSSQIWIRLSLPCVLSPGTVCLLLMVLSMGEVKNKGRAASETTGDLPGWGSIFRGSFLEFGGEATGSSRHRVFLFEGYPSESVNRRGDLRERRPDEQKKEGLVGSSSGHLEIHSGVDRTV